MLKNTPSLLNAIGSVGCIISPFWSQPLRVHSVIGISISFQKDSRIAIETGQPPSLGVRSNINLDSNPLVTNLELMHIAKSTC